MPKFKATDVVFLIALLWVFMPSSAYAYLDPGTGSYVVQVIVASVLGAGFFLKSSWKNISYKIGRIFSK